MPEPPPKRKLAAILSADVVGYSRLMGADEARTVATLKDYRAVMGRVITRRAGRVVNAPGDALLAEFPSAVEAVQCAVEIQQVLTGRNVELPSEGRMQFRIGVNLGDVIEEADGTLYGDGVNISARMEALAEAGGVCISSTVYDAVEGKLALGFDFLGEQQVKNIAKPVRVYRVRTEPRPTPPRRAVWRRLSSRVRLPVLGAAALIVLLAAGALTWQVMRTRAPVEDPVLALPKGPSIAVLPFANLSGDPKQDYFADGITEQLITELTRFRNLRVIARNSTFRYKGQSVDVRQVGRELGANYVLEGGVQRDNRTIRVTAQLLDPRHGGHLWAETYERRLTAAGIFDLQDDITERVVATIGDAQGVIGRATFEQTKVKGTLSLDAYECVLQTYAYWRGRGPADHLKARDCLERALKLDPNYAEGWATLADVYLDEHRQGFNQRQNPLDRSLNAARRALDLDPTNQSAHMQLAFNHFFRRDLDTFYRLAEEAIALNPNNPEVLALIGNAMTYGFWTTPRIHERGNALVRKAMALTPFYPDWYHYSLAWSEWWKGEYQKALTEAQKINQPDYFWTHGLLAAIYGAQGRTNDAAPAVANLLRLYPDIPVKVRGEWKKWNVPDEVIDRAVADLRRAGLNIPPGT